MHESHWGLQESPFQTTLNPRFFYEAPAHDEALSRMLFLVEHRRRMGLVLGDSGAGKSLLIEVLVDKFRRQGVETAAVRMRGLTEDSFLRELADSLRLTTNSVASIHALWRGIADRFAEHRYRQTPLVIFLDDVDLAEPEALTQLLRLIALDTTPDAQVTFVLSASTCGLSKLPQTLVDLIDLRTEIENWEADDTIEYLETAATQAGRETPLFEADAAKRLHELTGGVPRKVAQLAELALVAGAGAELEVVDQHTIDAVYEELSGCGVSVGQ